MNKPGSTRLDDINCCRGTHSSSEAINFLKFFLCSSLDPLSNATTLAPVQHRNVPHQFGFLARLGLENFFWVCHVRLKAHGHFHSFI